jgi:hypothetical protein
LTDEPQPAPDATLPAVDPPPPPDPAIPPDTQDPPEAPKPPPPRPAPAWRRYLFAIVPAIGLFELGAHVIQATRHVPDSDWLAARALVKGMARPDDLVAFAPGWVDPIGRSMFKDEIASVAREARPDDSRFARAIEVSIRGAHLPELAGWHEEARQKVGAITVTTFDNPKFERVLDDLVTHLDPARATVARVDGGRETPCPFTHSHSQTGSIGFGPAIPADRFACPASFVGVSVAMPLDYHPHRCIYSQLPSGATTRLRFHDVAFGRMLHGHHAISWAQERYKNGTPVTMSFTVGDRLLGRVVHHDGDSWKAFDLDTSDLAGQTAELVVDVSTPSSRERSYCFEADTR